MGNNVLTGLNPSQGARFFFAPEKSRDFRPDELSGICTRGSGSVSAYLVVRMQRPRATKSEMREMRTYARVCHEVARTIALTLAFGAPLGACSSDTTAPPAPGEGRASPQSTLGVRGAIAGTGGASDDAGGRSDANDTASPDPSGVVVDASVDDVLPSDAGSVLPEVDPEDVLTPPDGSVSFGFDANFTP
jgi:hypothetical protein